jgi:hypothetical protein
VLCCKCCKLILFRLTLGACEGYITLGWMLGRLLPPFWLHWILEVTCSGYPVTVSSVPLWLATVEIWYASPLFSSLMLISEDVCIVTQLSA